MTSIDAKTDAEKTIVQTDKLPRFRRDGLLLKVGDEHPAVDREGLAGDLLRA